MANPYVKGALLLVAGFALRSVSKFVEGIGDSYADGFDRLPMHLFALLLLVSAVICFLLALRNFWRGVSGGGAAAPVDPSDPVELTPMPAATAFDPDAIIARYTAQRSEGDVGEAAEPHRPSLQTSPPPPPAPRGFGRRGL